MRELIAGVYGPSSRVRRRYRRTRPMDAADQETVAPGGIRLLPARFGQTLA
jgi:hypothetical protein